MVVEGGLPGPEAVGAVVVVVVEVEVGSVGGLEVNSSRTSLGWLMVSDRVRGCRGGGVYTIEVVQIIFLRIWRRLYLLLRLLCHCCFSLTAGSL